MRKVPFSDGWYYRHLDQEEAFIPVIIPHDAMLSEPRNELSAGGINTGWYEGHDYLYEKIFTPGLELAGQTIVLEFEGVYRNAIVSLNGTELMFRPYGYTNFYVDITDKVNFDAENTLEVVAHNADQPNSRWYSGAGIYRPVYLWTAPKKHIQMNGVRIRTVSLEPATVEVAVLTTAPGEVTIEICDGDKPIAAGTATAEGEAVLTLTVPNAKLWSPEAPNLYTCKAVFGTDSHICTFGIRTLTWGKDGICINGQRTIIQGACIHHDNGILGSCCYEDAEWRKIQILKDNGYNAVRSAHNPCSKYLLDACDHLGILVMDEYIDHWYIHKTEYDYAEHFMEWWRQDLTDMVEKDYNHPSVIMYSTGNEVSETAQSKGIALTKQMTEFLHSLDATRPVTCGVNIFFNFLSSIGFGVYSDDKAKKEAEKAKTRQRTEDKPKKKKAVGSEFFNNMAGLLGAGFMKLGATLPPCDWRTKDAFASMDIAGYNYGIYRYKHDLKKYPDRLILGSETFCSDAYQFRELAKQNPRLVGDFVWAGMDYLGELGVGAWEYADYAPDFSHGVGWTTAGCGRVDLIGTPQGEAYYTRVALEKDPGPYIAVCPVNHTGDKHSPSAWRMSNALPNWSWSGWTGKPADVEVYARAAKVELFLNGKSVGAKAIKDNCVAKFRCDYEDGMLMAVAYQADGTVVGRTYLNTASSVTKLRAVPEKDHVAPGRLCFIRLRYTDETGIVKPLERGSLSVEVSGGRLLGLGSACPYHERSYCGTVADTYFGEALAVVLAGSGKAVEITANDGKNIGKAVISIEEV